MLTEYQYEIELHSPMGAKKGFLLLLADNNTLSGELNLLGHSNKIEYGSLGGEISEFFGKLKTAVDEIDYHVIIMELGNQFQAVAYTTKGKMQITGKKSNK